MQRLHLLTLPLVCLLWTACPSWAASRVDAVGITVTDIDRAVDFYHGVLGFELEADREVTGNDYGRLFGVSGARVRVARLGLGSERLELIEFLAPRGRPIPADSRSNDRWFQHVAIIVSDMERAYAHLRAHGVTHASPEPQRLPDWNPNAGGIKAFYFRDPDGNHLEVLSFPPDKGAMRWQRKDALFLGIDHTAVVVADTDHSLAYYRDVLGMRVVGTSENYGPEQERLNNVSGARLRITGLAADAGGIGVEFLQYLAPGDGRSTPGDTQANDLWHWQVHVATDELDTLADRLRRGGYAFVSPGITETRDGRLGFRRGLMIRDPDGHAGLLMERTGTREESP